jgi:hypothetical protein
VALDDFEAQNLFRFTSEWLPPTRAAFARDVLRARLRWLEEVLRDHV